MLNNLPVFSDTLIMQKNSYLPSDEHKALNALGNSYSQAILFHPACSTKMIIQRMEQQINLLVKHQYTGHGCINNDVLLIKLSLQRYILAYYTKSQEKIEYMPNHL